jgi:ribosomal subunit interface protein
MTDEVREYLGKKIASLETFFDKNDPTVAWDIELEQLDERVDTDNMFRAEFNLRMNGEVFRAEATGATMLAALDEVKDALKITLRERHSKSRHFIRDSGRRFKDFLRGWRSK